jgi:hypothetical protein
MGRSNSFHTHGYALYRSELVRPRLHAVVPRALEDVLPAFGVYRPSARP